MPPIKKRIGAVNRESALFFLGSSMRQPHQHHRYRDSGEKNTRYTHRINMLKNSSEPQCIPTEYTLKTPLTTKRFHTENAIYSGCLTPSSNSVHPLIHAPFYRSYRSYWSYSPSLPSLPSPPSPPTHPQRCRTVRKPGVERSDTPGPPHKQTILEGWQKTIIFTYFPR